MAYGILKVDTITFTDGGVDKSVTISGLVQNPTFTGNVTVTGTISGDTVRGQTISGVTVTGTTAQFTSGTFVSLTGTTLQGTTATYTTGSFTSLTGTTTSGTTANFVSGVFSTQISGATVTGTTANFTSGNFTNISGGTHTITSGVFALGTATNPSISFTSDPNTGIYSPGADQVAISTNGTGRLFVDASGRVLAGTDTAIPQGANVGFGRLQVFGTGSTQELLGRFSADASAAVFAFLKSRNATIGSHTIVNSGDTLGQINFQGSDGTDYLNAALIRAEVDGTPGTNDMPGRLVFSTTADGSASPTERMRLDSSGRLGLGTSSPGQALDVKGIVRSSIGTGTGAGGAGYALYQFGTSATATENWHIGAEGDGSFRFYNQGVGAGLERVRITSAGNVGIGTTSPSASLEVFRGTITVTDPNSITTGDTGTYGALWSQGASLTQAGFQIAFNTGSNNARTERARIDSSGRLLVGASIARNAGNFADTTGRHIFVETTDVSVFTGIANKNDGSGPQLVLGSSRGTSVGSNTALVQDDKLGTIKFNGADGTTINPIGAQIQALVDGTPGTNDMPGRIVLSTTLDGASSPTEALRITNDRVIARNQGAPAAVNATATLTVANLKTGIITSTSAAATDMTLPTGTDTQAGFSGTYDNFTFEWSVINTGPSLVRVLAGTAHTIVGSGSVATGTSGRFASRRTAANTFVTYRLS